MMMFRISVFVVTVALGSLGLAQSSLAPSASQKMLNSSDVTRLAQQARAGSPHAQYEYGMALLFGMGTQRDDLAAAKWIRRPPRPAMMTPWRASDCSTRLAVA